LLLDDEWGRVLSDPAQADGADLSIRPFQSYGRVESHNQQDYKL
jgi:hypothetical protein